VTLTSNDTTKTTYTLAADTGSESAAAAGDRLTLPPADRHSDAFEPRSRYARFEPGKDDLELSGDPKAALDDPPSHLARAGAGS
jgi:hypothetical protein